MFLFTPLFEVTASIGAEVLLREKEWKVWQRLLLVIGRSLAAEQQHNPAPQYSSRPASVQNNPPSSH